MAESSSSSRDASETRDAQSIVHDPSRRTGGPLVRATLLATSKNALDGARSVHKIAERRHTTPEMAVCLQHLRVQQEIVAERAANVALANATTAHELRNLRNAIRQLISLHGWTKRKLGLVGQMN